MSEENQYYFEIQKHDLELLSIDNKISIIKKELFSQQGIPDMKQKVILIEEKLKQQQKIQIQINQSIEECNETINGLNTTLYSGKIRNNKEVEAIQLELQTKTNILENLNPKSSKVLENINKLKDLKESMEIKIMTTEEDWNNLEIKLNEQINSFNKKKIYLLEIKNSLSKSLDNNVLNLYENFLSKSGSIGIAKLENNISSCCKMELPNAFIEKIKSTTTPIVCNCGKSLISE
jgi:predicted  nucleic acid-binding Zn-ribbon protein